MTHYNYSLNILKYYEIKKKKQLTRLILILKKEEVKLNNLKNKREKEGTY